MPITINISNKNQPASLGLTRRFDFLGEGYRYRITKEISVSGNLLDLANGLGVKGITDEIEATILGFVGPSTLDDVIINGFNFGKGFMNSVYFSSGNDVRIKEYSASFTVYETGDIGSLGVYNPSSSLNSLLLLANSISESFDFDQNQKNKTYSHKVDLTAIDSSTQNGIAVAKAVADILLASEDFPALYWGSAKTPFNTYFNESYNRITNACSFEKTYELNDGENNFLKSRTSSFDFNENGVVAVTESAEYTAKWNKTDDMINAAKADMATSYSRCDAIYQKYKNINSNIDTSATLFNKPITRGSTITDKSGFASYTVTYTNDLFYSKEYNDAPIVSSTAYWEYSIELNTDSEDVTTVTESGRIIGSDKLDGQSKQNNANNFWKDSIKPASFGSAPARISNFYGKRKNLYCSGTELNLNDWSVTKSNRLGAVDYKITYTDSRSRQRGRAKNWKRLDSSCGTQADEQIKLSTNVIVPKVNEIKQRRVNNIHEKASASATAIVAFSALNFNDVLNTLKSELIPCNKDYIESATYSFNPLTKNVSLNLQTFEPT